MNGKGSPDIHGDTSGLKASHAKALARLAERTIPPDQVVSGALAAELLELAHELHRQVGLFVDRRGRVRRVILGDTHSLDLPEFERVRGVQGRLRGVRLLVTHLVPDPLNREELADLAKLRLDLVTAIHRGASGIALDVACLWPAEGTEPEVFAPRVFPRIALGLLTRDLAEGTSPTASATVGELLPLDRFVQGLETRLVAATDRAMAESSGTRAMVLLVHDGGADTPARRAELRELCRTAGVALVELVEQRRPHPDPRTFFGTGKLREVLVRALEQEVELLICDPELSASQARTISDLTDLKVIDRTMLILDIFAQHARSSDGKLQVELAQLRYRLPRMVGKGTMMSRLAGGIGGRGPGETKLEIDRRRAKERITDLEKRLVRLKQQRDQKRALRHRAGVPVVAIVGYTNAGKSTLLNSVTQSEVLAENKLFATLDPTVRRIRFPSEHEVVVLDTVGFIRDLPPALLDAFSSTLEEIATADLILHVIDVADPDTPQQIETVERILASLGADHVPRFRVFNKIDLLPPERLAARKTELVSPEAEDKTSYLTSALDRRSTRALMEAVERQLWHTGRIRPRAEFATSTDAELDDAEFGDDDTIVDTDEPNDGEFGDDDTIVDTDEPNAEPNAELDERPLN